MKAPLKTAVLSTTTMLAILAISPAALAQRVSLADLQAAIDALTAQVASLEAQNQAQQETISRLESVIAVMADGTARFVVPGDREEVTGGDQTESVAGDLVVQVGGNYDTQVARDHRVFADGNLVRGADRALIVQAGEGAAFAAGESFSIQAGEDASIVAGESIILDAADELVLRSGVASIVLRSNGDIRVQGNDIDLLASGTLRLAGQQIETN